MVLENKLNLKESCELAKAEEKISKLIKMKSKKEGLLLLGDDFLSLIEIILLLN